MKKLCLLSLLMVNVYAVNNEYLECLRVQRTLSECDTVIYQYGQLIDMKVMTKANATKQVDKLMQSMHCPEMADKLPNCSKKYGIY